jgi:hypothetical protein
MLSSLPSNEAIPHVFLLVEHFGNPNNRAKWWCSSNGIPPTCPAPKSCIMWLLASRHGSSHYHDPNTARLDRRETLQIQQRIASDTRETQWPVITATRPRGHTPYCPAYIPHPLAILHIHPPFKYPRCRTQLPVCAHKPTPFPSHIMRTHRVAIFTT